MKLIYTGAHLKVYNMVSRSNQIINSAHFYEDLKGFLDQHYNENVVAEFLKRLKNSNFEIKVSSHWKPFSKRFIYIDKSIS